MGSHGDEGAYFADLILPGISKFLTQSGRIHREKRHLRQQRGENPADKARCPISGPIEGGLADLQGPFRRGRRRFALRHA